MGEYTAHGSVSRVGGVSIKAETFWLELGHLRALVAEADRLGLADGAGLRLSGLEKHLTYTGEWTARVAHVSGTVKEASDADDN